MTCNLLGFSFIIFDVTWMQGEIESETQDRFLEGECENNRL